MKQGTLMMMPDIRDKMPQRSFLPKSIASKLPISSVELPNLKRIFHSAAMEHIMASSIAECEREPSRGETKKCVGRSAEDMIDFATSVLGHNVVVQSTENVKVSHPGEFGVCHWISENDMTWASADHV